MTEREKCPSCKGRGWHIGECHPQEACGACVGTGYQYPELAVGDLKAEVTRLSAELATAKERIEQLRKGILVYRRGRVDANNENSADGIRLADLLLSWDPVPTTKEELEQSFAEMLYEDKVFTADDAAGGKRT